METMNDKSRRRRTCRRRHGPLDDLTVFTFIFECAVYTTRGQMAVGFMAAKNIRSPPPWRQGLSRRLEAGDVSFWL